MSYIMSGTNIKTIIVKKPWQPQVINVIVKKSIVNKLI